ncbi:uncharacterized protein LOC121903874 [Scomber scombrus]|uniref:Uncharacterized protein LOC121903874 n=1 Tax=Scomber scombrus TaxID=13677 RepID=A0AAV1PFN7_SCOSC
MYVVTGGNSHVFYCETPDCATNVTRVFCNDNLLFSDANIPKCTGPPSPSTVCQHNGRAFISRDTDGPCEFEGPNGYMETKKCRDLSNICDFTNGSAPPPLSTKGQENDKESHVTEISVGVIFLVTLLLTVLGLTAYFCMKRKKDRSQQQANDSDVTVPLEDTQSSGETRES